MRQAYDYWQNQPGIYLKSSVAHPQGAFTPSHTPPQKGVIRISTRSGRTAEAPRPARDRKSTGHPIAPTEFPKAWSGADMGFATLNVGPNCTIHPSRGGYRGGPTPRTERTRPRLAPKCLITMIAIGQPSTDSFGAHRLGLWVFRPPARHTAPDTCNEAAMPGEIRRSGGATHHPDRSQRTPPKRPAVTLTRPTIGGLTVMGQ